MKNKLELYCGSALIIGSMLMIVTMVLHPSGGSIDHLFKILKMVAITHSIAILSVPVIVFGFWGLTIRLNADEPLSIAAFIVICLGMVSVMFAAGINGLAMPIFLSEYKNAPPQIIDTIKPILNYSMALNHMCDYIFIGAVCLSVVLWSIVIVRYKQLPVWAGYLGIILSVLSVVLLGAGFVFVNLSGFRMFIFFYVAWIIIIGVLLNKPRVVAAMI